jgi:hypothetical protein
MMQLLWMAPVGAFIAYGLWRFASGTGPRRQQTSDEEGQDIQVGLGAETLDLP